MRLIEISHTNCVGCRLCEMICSLVHEDECSTAKSRIKIVRDEEFGNNLVTICTQCAEAHCLESCPSAALRRDETSGVMLIDDARCTGCEICVDACPLGAISYDRQRDSVRTCDLCGGDPECVKFCSRGTLAFKEIEIGSPERRSFMEETVRRRSAMRDLRRFNGCSPADAGGEV